MKAFPFAALKPFDMKTYPFHEGAKAKPDTGILEDSAFSRANMALVNVVGKKSVHPSAVIRVRIKTRAKEALRLVVTRGAYANKDGQLEFNETDVGEERWLVKGMPEVSIF